MDTYFRFLYEFLLQFFGGFGTIFSGLFKGVKQIFSIESYIKIINFYKDDFSGPEWLFVAIAIILVVLMIAIIVFLIFLLVRKYIRIRKSLVEQESLLEEVSLLNSEVATLMSEKQDILAMKVSHLAKPSKSRSSRLYSS